MFIIWTSSIQMVTVFSQALLIEKTLKLEFGELQASELFKQALMWPVLYSYENWTN